MNALTTNTPYYTRILRNLYRRFRSSIRQISLVSPCMVAIVAAVVLSGCVYKSQIRQGDDMLPLKIDSLEIGMTRDEVINMLGNHAVPKVFASNSWLYYYRERPAGFFPKPHALAVELVFDGEELAEINHLHLSESPPPPPTYDLQDWKNEGEEEAIFVETKDAEELTDEVNESIEIESVDSVNIEITESESEQSEKSPASETKEGEEGVTLLREWLKQRKEGTIPEESTDNSESDS